MWGGGEVRGESVLCSVHVLVGAGRGGEKEKERMYCALYVCMYVCVCVSGIPCICGLLESTTLVL